MTKIFLKLSLWIWLISLTIIIELTCAIPWWHPYCNHQADGTGFASIGIPLPYAQPTGISSLQDSYLPHVLLLNLFLIGFVLYPLLSALVRRIADWSDFASKLMACLGAVFFLVIICPVVVITLIEDYPTTSLDLSDSYMSHRPMFLALKMGNKACDG